MTTLSRVWVLALTVLLLVGVLPASAGSATLNGVLDASDPTMPVVIIWPPQCLSQGGNLVYHEATLFSVGTSGVYTLDLTSTGGFASFYLYEAGFDPANGMANCVAADNSAPKQIVYSLTQDAAYYVVVFDDGIGQPGGSYTVEFSGPGDIYIGSVGSPDIEETDSIESIVSPGCDVLMPIPATAVGGTFVADAPVYWKPGELTSPLVTIKAGNTARVIGLDASGQYYKIIWVCDYLWVPKATLGPNYDAVWNGAPLPVEVVE